MIAATGLFLAASSTRADDALVESLVRLQEQGLWGEAIVGDGKLRQIKVHTISGDSVFVREVIGPFQLMNAMYLVGDFRSLRELGAHRIALRGSTYRSQKSMLTGLLLELGLPGSGYYYTGEHRQALAVALISAAALAAGIQTGEDGAVGWIPVLTWTRIASLLHLADEIGAANESVELRGVSMTAFNDVDRVDLNSSWDAWPGRGRTGGVTIPLVAFHRRF